MIGRSLLRALTFACATGLAGCGAVTPSFQEPWGEGKDALDLQAKIAAQVECELAQAVRSLIFSSVGKQLAFIRDWNAQVQLNLTASNKGSFDPQLVFTEPLANAISHFSNGNVTTSQSITLGLGASYSNEAIRQDKVFLTYKVRDFVNSKRPPSSCIPHGPNSGTLFIVQSDLKIYEWLAGALGILVSQGPDSEVDAHPRIAKKADALSHDIKFEIITSGSVTPTLKLVRWGTAGSPFFKGTRNRSQQLVITMGPPDKANPEQLGPTAQGASLAAQINAAVGALRRIEP